MITSSIQFNVISFIFMRLHLIFETLLHILATRSGALDGKKSQCSQLREQNTIKGMITMKSKVKKVAAMDLQHQQHLYNALHRAIGCDLESNYKMR